MSAPGRGVGRVRTTVSDVALRSTGPSEAHRSFTIHPDVDGRGPIDRSLFGEPERRTMLWGMNGMDPLAVMMVGFLISLVI
jgi:hypothetical protein